MQFTSKHHFRKPEGPDTYNVQDFNANWDILEGVLKDIQSFIENEGVTPEKVVAAINEAVAHNMIVNVNRLQQKQSADFATKEQGTRADAALPRTGGVMSGDINLSQNRITNVSTPVDTTDVSNKAYVDSKAGEIAKTATSADASNFPAHTWVQNHWDEIPLGVTTYRVLHNSDLSTSVMIIAKKNASNGSAVIANNRGRGMIGNVYNGVWTFLPFARTHVNHLNSTDAEATLAAPQGKALNDRITEINNELLSQINTLVNQVNALDTELKKKLAKFQAVNASVIDGVRELSKTVTFAHNSTNLGGSLYQKHASIVVDPAPGITNYTVYAYQIVCDGIYNLTYGQPNEHRLAGSLAPGQSKAVNACIYESGSSNVDRTITIVYKYHYNRPAV